MNTQNLLRACMSVPYVQEFLWCILPDYSPRCESRMFIGQHPCHPEVKDDFMLQAWTVQLIWRSDCTAASRLLALNPGTRKLMNWKEALRSRMHHPGQNLTYRTSQEILIKYSQNRPGAASAAQHAFGDQNFHDRGLDQSYRDCVAQCSVRSVNIDECFAGQRQWRK